MTHLSELDVLSLTIWGEARSEAIEGRVAVGNVIRNRIGLGRWGSTYESVCLAPMQFSCWTAVGGAANYQTLKGVREQIMRGEMPNDPDLRECYWIGEGLQTRALRDNVSKATFYFVTRSTVPKWAVNHLPVHVIGAHSFFSEIA